MDLWVRTQDRKILTKITDLEIDEENCIVVYNHNGDVEITLGMYQTKERALEVLDEIQSLITPNYKELVVNYKNKISDISKLTNIVLSEKPDGDITIQELSNVVYQMPEE